MPWTYTHTFGALTQAPASYLDTNFQEVPFANKSAAVVAAIGLLQQKGTTIPSATSIDLSAATGNFINISGVATITGVTLAEGKQVAVRATGAFTVQNGASLVVQGNANYTCTVGDLLLFIGDSSSVVRVYISRFTGQPVNPASSNVSSATQNLAVSAGNATQATITADAIAAIDTGGFITRLTAVNVTATITTSGANGLDTGAEAANTWYSIWVIYNPGSGTTASLLSTSATNPTMPSGYTFKRRVGWVRNDAGSDFLRFTQKGNRVQFTVGTTPSVAPQMASGAAGSTSVPTWVAVATGAYVPTTAGAIIGFAVAQPSAGQVIVAPNNGYGQIDSSSNPPPVGLIDNNVMFEFNLESSNIYWASNNANNRLCCLGWYDNL
ncbi:MAG: hypothetical protein AB7J28_16735 [Hyphomonadaceae bacterium]